jgi:hypothetical protein
MPIKLFFISLLIISLLPACGVSKGPLFAQGEIAGELISAEMDSPIAKYSLAPSDDEPLGLKKRRVHLESSINTIPTSYELQLLVEQGSADFASIVLARALLEQGHNKRWQTQSYQLSKKINSQDTKERLTKSFEQHHALLIPGWHWKTRSDTGADLEFQRRILASFGLQSTLVETNEHGTVEENGLLIAKAINNTRSLNKPIVIISVSKGGAETAYALGAELNENQTSYIKGWLNIGGLIAGSSLVNHSANNPKRWLRSIGFSEDTPVSAFNGLNTRVASARMATLSFPGNLTIINYVGMPFASSVNEKAKYSYSLLASKGPNDGAALTQEMLMPNGHTVLEIGLDHYMRSRRAMNRAISLLLMIMECEVRSTCE